MKLTGFSFSKQKWKTESIFQYQLNNFTFRHFPPRITPFEVKCNFKHRPTININSLLHPRKTLLTLLKHAEVYSTKKCLKTMHSPELSVKINLVLHVYTYL